MKDVNKHRHNVFVTEKPVNDRRNPRKQIDKLRKDSLPLLRAIEYEPNRRKNAQKSAQQYGKRSQKQTTYDHGENAVGVGCGVIFRSEQKSEKSRMSERRDCRIQDIKNNPEHRKDGKCRKDGKACPCDIFFCESLFESVARKSEFQIFFGKGFCDFFFCGGKFLLDPEFHNL